MRVLRRSCPVFGRTPEPARAFSADDIRGFYACLLRALGVNRLNLIGHSNGGRIIMKLCAREDAGIEIRKLVL
jgi:pimeloyl-ACP methyl ester carboxylesterase